MSVTTAPSSGRPSSIETNGKAKVASHPLSGDLGGTGIYCEHCGTELRDRWVLPESVQRIIEGLTPKALANRRSRGQPPECSVSMGRAHYRLSTIVQVMCNGTVSNSRAGRAHRDAQKSANLSPTGTSRPSRSQPTNPAAEDAK